MKPIVTIGLCVKNSEKTVSEAINSIINQDFSDELMELVVVDGYSKDRTLSIIKEALTQRKIKTRVFFEGKGLGFARQIVVNNAVGEYIVWVDGDIVISDKYIKKQVDFMEKHPQAAIASGCLGIMPGDNWVALLEDIGYVIESLRQRGKIATNLLGTKGTIFRTKAIRMVGGFDLRFRGAQEDLDASWRMVLVGWKSSVTDALLFEKQKKTWSALWKRHFWYGYGLHIFQHKNKTHNMVTNKSTDRILFSSQAYKLTHRKVTFLLPLIFIFRKAALLFGFMKAHFDGYGHNFND